jgi:hypothetical protein
MSRTSMPEPESPVPMPDTQAPWHVPVTLNDVAAETGRHFDLVADADIRAAVARVADLRELPRLQASFDVTRYGSDGLHVTGRVSATVGQNCVVTLEPLANEVDEAVDLVFAPPSAVRHKAAAAYDDAEDESERPKRSWNGPEPLVGGVVDLGALTTEFLILGLDPYPRKPGAVFEPPQDVKPDPGPFAALSGLKARDGQ